MEELKIKNERRNNGQRMTDEHFRQHTLETFMMIQNRLDIGNSIMEDLREKIDSHFKIHAMDISDLKEKIDINTELTKKIESDTAGIVSIYQTGKKTAEVVTNGTKKVSKWSRILAPIIIMGTILGMLFHGHLPTWSDVIKAIK